GGGAGGGRRPARGGGGGGGSGTRGGQHRRAARRADRRRRPARGGGIAQSRRGGRRHCAGRTARAASHAGICVPAHVRGRSRMIASLRAEWARLIRRRVLLGALLSVLLAGVAGATIVLAAAEP